MKIDVKAIIMKYINRIMKIKEYNFEKICDSVVPIKNNFCILNEETEKEIKEGIYITMSSLLLTKVFILLMNFCTYFKANKILGPFGYVFKITFNHIIMSDLAKIIVDSLLLIVIPLVFLVYIFRFHNCRQKTHFFSFMTFFSLLMVLKKAIDIFNAFTSVTDSIIVMILVILCYLIAAVGYLCIMKGCIDFCIFAYDEHKKTIPPAQNNVNLNNINEVVNVYKEQQVTQETPVQNTVEGNNEQVSNVENNVQPQNTNEQINNESNN